MSPSSGPPAAAAGDLIHVPPVALTPYARNAKKHSDEQVAKIAASIRDLGFRAPVIIDGNNGIIAGHGRVLAALRLGLKTVPCIDASDMSEVQKRAYVIADNRLSEDAPWDDAILGSEMRDLSNLGVDLTLTGFDVPELDGILNTVTSNLGTGGVSSGGGSGGSGSAPPCACPNCGRRFVPAPVAGKGGKGRRAFHGDLDDDVPF